MTDPSSWIEASDLDRLFEGSEPVHVPAGGEILTPEEAPDALYLVEEGRIQVERADGGERFVVAQLGPGEVVGEMSLILDRPATAHIVATDDAKVRRLPRDLLVSRLDADPLLAARTYRSLAAVLARRLLATTALMSEPLVPTARGMRSGNATTIQIPAALVATVDAFRRGMDRLQEEASAGSFDEAALQRAVAEQCDALLTGLEAELTPEALVDAGWSDLLSLRDTSAVAAGLGDYVYREVLPFLLQSSAFAHCAARAGGFAGDAETEAVLLQPDADGDGVLGPGVDAWFRHRAFVQSRRERREMIEPLLRAVVPGGHVFVLGGGNGRELRRALGQEVHATVVDSDPEALAALGQRLARAGSRDLVTLVQADILGVVRGVTPMSLPPLSFAYAVGLSDHLTSDQMAEVIEWAAGLLSPGGTLAATFTAADCPDRVLVDEVIGWRVQRWTEEAVRSVFGRRKAEMIRSATGVTLLATSRG